MPEAAGIQESIVKPSETALMPEERQIEKDSNFEERFTSVNSRIGSILQDTHPNKDQLSDDDLRVVYKGLFEKKLLPRVAGSLVGLMASPVAEFRSSSTFFVEANLKYFESLINSSDLDARTIAFFVVSNLTRYGQPPQKVLGHSVLWRHFSEIKTGLKNDRYCEPEVLIGLLENATDQQKEDVEKSVLEFYDDPECSTGSGIIARLLQEPGGSNSYNQGVKLLKAVCEKYGVSGKGLGYAWYKSGKHNEFESNVSRNLSAMRALEIQKQGIVKVLCNEFGIKDYARYPGEMLIQQYEERGKDIPYGLVLYPVEDHNGAFYQDGGVLSRLQKQLQETNPPYGLRIVEAGSKYGIAKAIIKLDRRYGATHKIAFAVIGGHGTKDSIRFGGFSDVLRIEDLVGRGVNRMGRFLAQHPTIILASCSTGKEGGIGEGVNQTFDAIVLAPDTDTSLKSILVEQHNGKLSFAVDYRDKDSSQRYPSSAENPKVIKTKIDQQDRVGEPQETALMPEEKQVEDFLSNLPTNGVPVLLKTKSGLGEDLLIALKVKKNTDHPEGLEEYLGGKIEDLITVVLYAKGNGLLHEEGKLGIIGHRDLAICKQPDGGVFVYSDKRTDDYLPEGEGAEVDPESVINFSGGSETIERQSLIEENTQALLREYPDRMEKVLAIVKEKGDPYKKGLGALLQSVGVDRAIRMGATKVVTNMMSEDAIRIWAGSGIPVKPGESRVVIDKPMVTKKIQGAVLPHISVGNQ